VVVLLAVERSSGSLSTNKTRCPRRSQRKKAGHFRGRRR